MPFVQTVREKAEKDGFFEVNKTSSFNQLNVLESVKEYLVNTLQLNTLTFFSTSNKSTPPEILKTCSPGAPIIMYSFGEEVN